MCVCVRACACVRMIDVINEEEIKTFLNNLKFFNKQNKYTSIYITPHSGYCTSHLPGNVYQYNRTEGTYKSYNLKVPLYCTGMHFQEGLLWFNPVATVWATAPLMIIHRLEVYRYWYNMISLINYHIWSWGGYEDQCFTTQKLYFIPYFSINTLPQ